MTSNDEKITHEYPIIYEIIGAISVEKADKKGFRSRPQRFVHVCDYIPESYFITTE